MNKSRLLLLLLCVGIATNVIAAPPQEPLTVTVQGDGIVTSDPAGINCPSDCTESYKKASTIILTATADSNSNFLGWEGACVGTQPTCEVKMLAPTNVTAMFSAATIVYPAPVAQTGQTSCYDLDVNIISCEGSGQDGEYQSGVPLPNPRFTDNLDGTVTDNLTGLIWVKDHACAFLNDPDAVPARNPDWQMALDQISLLGDGNCGLSDGSQPGDWIMPNVNQLMSLYNWGNMLFGTPFEHPFEDFGGSYWSSTTFPSEVSEAWGVQFGVGPRHKSKIYVSPAWAVRRSN